MITPAPLSSPRRHQPGRAGSRMPVILRPVHGEFQVGLDPRTALVFAGAGFADLLDRLRTRRPLRPAWTARRQAAGLIDRSGDLAPCTGCTTPGLLPTRSVDRSAGRPPRSDWSAPARSGCRWPVTCSTAAYAELYVFDDHPPDPDLYPTAGAAARPGRRARARVLGSGPARVQPLDPLDQARDAAGGPHRGGGRRTGGRPGDHRPPAAARSAAPARGPLARAMRPGSDRWCCPGGRSCLRCADLTRRDADPAWPTVLAQLSRLRLTVPDAADRLGGVGRRCPGPGLPRRRRARDRRRHARARPPICVT